MNDPEFELKIREREPNDLDEALKLGHWPKDSRFSRVLYSPRHRRHLADIDTLAV